MTAWQCLQKSNLIDGPPGPRPQRVVRVGLCVAQLYMSMFETQVVAVHKPPLIVHTKIEMTRSIRENQPKTTTLALFQTLPFQAVFQSR